MPVSSQAYELTDSCIAEEDLLGGRGERHWVVSADLLIEYYSAPELSPYLTPFPYYPDLSIVKVAKRPWHEGQTERGVNGIAGPWLWEVIVYYQTLWDPADAPMMTTEISADVLDVGYGGVWSDGTPAFDQAISMLFPVTTVTLEESMLDSINIPLIMSLQGTVNQYPFILPLEGTPVATGCALFEGTTSRKVWDFNYHAWKNRMQFRFRLRNLDWNLLWRKGTGGWDYRTWIDGQGNANYNYNYADWSGFGFAEA